jgi:hypothetical protein
VSAPYWNGRRTAGLAVGLVGVAGVAVGAALGAVALSKNSASKLDCSPENPNLCNDTGASLRSTAITLGNASTAAFAVGGAMVVGGIVLFVTAPSAKRPPAALVEILPGLGGLALRGRF